MITYTLIVLVALMSPQIHKVVLHVLWPLLGWEEMRHHQLLPHAITRCHTRVDLGTEFLEVHGPPLLRVHIFNEMSNLVTTQNILSLNVQNEIIETHEPYNSNHNNVPSLSLSNDRNISYYRALAMNTLFSNFYNMVAISGMMLPDDDYNPNLRL